MIKPKEIRINLRAWSWVIWAIAFGGCASVSLDEVSKQYYEGNPIRAYKLAKEGANLHQEEKNAQEDELLWQIQGGIIGFDLKDPQAKELFESAERRINTNEQSGILVSLFKNFEAILLNDAMMNYQGFLYEGVMINYYKALLSMSENNYADARVEFNRASDRQRRIKEYYEKEILKAQAIEQQAYKNKENKGSIENQRSEMNKILQTYSNLSKFSSLTGFINPMIDYVSGIFFMLEGDQSKAIDFFKESYGVSRSEIIKQDWQMLQKGGYKKKQTWVIIEDGKSPSKIEKRFNLPIYTGSALLNVVLALPDIKEGVDFANSYRVKGSRDYQAQKISSLTPLVWNEFNKQIPFIITRGVISTTTKALIAYGAQQATKGVGWFEVFMALGGVIYTTATTRADLRIPILMPNGFFVARIENAQGEYKIFANEREIAKINFSQKCDNKQNLCIDKNHIIYVRNAQKNIFNQVIYSK